jgi:hypothetical protein
MLTNCTNTLVKQHPGPANSSHCQPATCHASNPTSNTNALSKNPAHPQRSKLPLSQQSEALLNGGRDQDYESGCVHEDDPRMDDEKPTPIAGLIH